MKLIFVTQQIDPADPVLGATVAKLRALAAQVDELVVLSLAAVPGSLPANCRVRTFGGRSRALRGVRFVRALRAELAGAGGVLAHMCPIYAVLAAPLVRPRRIPLLLWFAHWRASGLLRLATRLSTNVLSVDRRSYPVATDKLVPIGHGIDYADFPCAERGARTPFHALVLGRYSPAKGIETIVRAVAAVPGLRLVAHGATLTAEEEAHLEELRGLVEELGLRDRVHLGPPVPRHEIPALHARADALVNNMRAGAPDKAVYEACGSCLPVLASNPSFEELFAGIEPPLRFARERPDELADRLTALVQLDPEERAAIGATLRERVLASHSVDSWAAGVLRVVGGGR